MISDIWKETNSIIESRDRKNEPSPISGKGIAPSTTQVELLLQRRRRYKDPHLPKTTQASTGGTRTEHLPASLGYYSEDSTRAKRNHNTPVPADTGTVN